MTRITNLHIEQQGDLKVNLISFQRYLRASNYSPRTQDTYLTCPPKTDPTLELEFWNRRKGRYGTQEVHT